MISLERPVDLERIKTLRAMAIIIIGFAAGLLSGLLGVGGGIILIPAMVLLLGVNQHAAHGTSLAVIAVVVIISTGIYGSDGQVNWLIAVKLAVGGIIGARFGAVICNILCARRLKQYFGIFLLLVAVRMFMDYALSGRVELPQLNLPFDGFTGLVLILIVGVITGVLSGLFGVGGGMILVPAMVFLFGLPQHMAQGISLAVIIPVAFSGALIHAKYGNLRLGIWKWLTVGGILGGFFGARIALGLDETMLRGVFGIWLLIICFLMFRQKPNADDESDNTSSTRTS